MPLEADPQLHLLNLGQEPCGRIALLCYMTLGQVWPSLGLVFLGCSCHCLGLWANVP